MGDEVFALGMPTSSYQRSLVVTGRAFPFRPSWETNPGPRRQCDAGACRDLQLSPRTPLPRLRRQRIVIPARPVRAPGSENEVGRRALTAAVPICSTVAARWNTKLLDAFQEQHADRRRIGRLVPRLSSAPPSRGRLGGCCLDGTCPPCPLDTGGFAHRCTRLRRVAGGTAPGSGRVRRPAEGRQG